MLLKLSIVLSNNAPKFSLLYAQIMLHKFTLCSLHLYSYCNLITNITCLWISVVFIISLQHEISCTTEIMGKTLKLFLTSTNIV